MIKAYKMHSKIKKLQNDSYLQHLHCHGINSHEAIDTTGSNAIWHVP